MTGTPEGMKMVNVNLIYQVLIERHTATRQEISDRTGISLTTVRAVLEELMESGQIVGTHLDESSGGRRAQRYALNPVKNLILSFYLDTDRLHYQLVNLNGEVLEEGEEHAGSADLMDFVDRKIADWDICAIGVGVIGIVDQGKFFSGCTLDGLVENDLGEALQARYGLPVVLETDTVAIAYGYAIRYLEQHPECLAESVNLAYLYFSKTGCGAGFVVDGKPLHGAGHFAGELGFLPLEPGKTLAQVMSSPDSFEAHMDAVCRVIAIVNCVTNPGLVILGGDFLGTDSTKLDLIEHRLKERYLSEPLCPGLLLTDCGRTDYLRGVKELALRKILPLLPF